MDYSPGKKIVMLILILGIMMVGQKYWMKEPYSGPNLIYKYIPKSYYDELYFETPVRRMFGKMFHNAIPWMEAKPGYDKLPRTPYFFNHFAKNVSAYDNQDFYQDY